MTKHKFVEFHIEQDKFFKTTLSKIGRIIVLSIWILGIFFPIGNIILAKSYILLDLLQYYYMALLSRHKINKYFKKNIDENNTFIELLPAKIFFHTKTVTLLLLIISL